MKQRIIFFLLTFLFLLALACRSQPVSVPDAAPTSTTAPPTATPTITPSPTVTPRPSPTPIVARIDAGAQTIDEAGQLLIDRVVMTDPGWLVVFNELDGAPHEVIGATAVPFGVSADVEIELDLALVSETLFVELYHAKADSETFELAEHRPFSPPVSQQVEVSLEFSRPEIVVSDQDVGETGMMLIDEVLANEPGWILIHNYDNEIRGDLVGIVHVENGLSRDVVVPLRWREASIFLIATLAVDNGRLHVYEPELDTPVTIAREVVETPFEVTLPVDIVVYDQPLSEEGTFIIERVLSPADGWLAIYFDEDDAPGLIIGFAPVKAGVNEQVEVEVIRSAVTDILHIVLHRDTNPGDEFDLPANDQPFVIDGRAVSPSTFSTTPSDYILIEDGLMQNEGESGLVASTLYIRTSGWVIVQEITAGGALGDVISQTAVEPGVHRDFFIPLSEAYVGQTVMITLYLNSGDPELFEAEEAIDIPLRINQQTVQVPILVIQDEPLN